MRLLVFLLMCPTVIFSQKDSLNYYFDDDGLSNTANIVKANVISPLSGSYEMYFERKITDIFTIEAGAGLWYGGWLVYAPYDIPARLPFDSYSIQYTIQPKFYYRVANSSGAPESVFTGILIRLREADLTYDQISPYTNMAFTDILLNSGVQLFLNWRITICGNLGFGLSFAQNSKREGLQVDFAARSTSMIVNAGLKLGIRF